MSNNRLSLSPSDTIADPPRSTRASAVADDLRMKIMTGALAPNAHLRAQALANEYDLALSPIREALNRLASEGLVLAQDMRGFFVAPVSEKELRELTRTRCWLNETALRQSIALGGGDWEERLLLAYHRLSRLPRSHSGGAASANWNEAHRTFHRALTEGCGSAILVGFCDQLFVLAERYRNLSRRSPLANAGQRDDEHRAILEAALARDAGLAVELLNQHFTATAELCGLVLLEREAAAPSAHQSGKLQ
jgi:GntR family transcriptional regulator, carbon starvation induced regulator